jgi:hypothetical protein
VGAAVVVARAGGCGEDEEEEEDGEGVEEEECESVIACAVLGGVAMMLGVSENRPRFTGYGGRR